MEINSGRGGGFGAGGGPLADTTTFGASHANMDNFASKLTKVSNIHTSVFSRTSDLGDMFTMDFGSEKRRNLCAKRGCPKVRSHTSKEWKLAGFNKWRQKG